MGNRIFCPTIAMTAVVLAMSLAPVPAAGQDRPSPGTPGARRGPHLRALPARVMTPPRTPDGQPDLQGSWSLQRAGGPEHSLEYGLDPTSAKLIGVDAKNVSYNFLVDPMGGTIPYRPGAMMARRNENLANIYAPTKWEHVDAYDLCFLLGVPRGDINRKVIRQLPGYVIFTSPARDTRIIPLDGRPRLPANIKLYMGDSRGHWESNTLVIETTNNNDKTDFDRHGTFHSDALRVIERYTMVTADTMYYEVRFEDPTVFTQPWTIAITLDRNKDPERLWEDECWAGHERTAKIVLEAGQRAVAAGLKGIHLHDPDHPGQSYAPTILRETDPQTAKP